ncbi:hypothetical protein SOVF_067930 [Spinacia oleracea]|nr:hypothetical protein SOVF_067930 [Spinacia oleracea]
MIQENFEAGSAARIADCILALKSYYEWKEWSGGKGVYKHVTIKSPLLQSAAKNFSRPLNAISSQPSRRLDMSGLSAVDEKQSITDSIVKALTTHMVDSKENINENFRTSLQNGSKDPVQLFNEILSRCLEEKLSNQFPMLKSCSQDSLKEAGGSHASVSVLKENSSLIHNPECHRTQTRKVSKDHWRLLWNQERDLSDIKALWHKTKGEFEYLQSQLLNDLMHLGSLVEEMSTPALRYQKVVQENRKLYNMAQDLKGNVRVYCRIRPILNMDAKNLVDFVGQDGSLVIVDPSKPRPDGRKVFQFNQVYGPSATQDELFKEIQPLIRSVMDGFNVCILAYGETGSGKTHTMYGSSGISEKEMGINFLALKDLFQIAEKRKDTNYDVRIQMVVICNKEIQDLLAEVPAPDGESSLPDVAFHSVKSNVDAISLVNSGQRKYSCLNTSKINNLSSPFHSVVTIHVHGKDTSGNILRGCLHLVDLAASGEDDTSLSCLEDVITSLSQKNYNIQQGSSKITSLLQDALGGNAKVVVFTHVIPEGDNFAETVNTLKFAQKVSTIELGAVLSNKKNIEVTQLKQEIETLKSALGDKDPKSPLPNRQLRSPYDKTRSVIEKSPIKARRLSMENPGSVKSERLEKSPLKQLKITTDNPSDKLSNPTTSRSKEPKSPLEKPMLQGSFPRSRRLSIENPMTIRSEKKQKLKDPKSPSEGKATLKKLTPPRSRRLSIENPKAIADIRKSSKTPQTSLRARRLSLEGPKDCTKKGLRSADVVSSKDYISIMEFPASYTNGPTFTDCATEFPSVQPSPAAYTNGPTFTDCATKFPSLQLAPAANTKGPTFTDCATKIPSLQPPKTPERQKLDLNEMHTPGIAKSTNKKGSQIKRSLRTIGKLINGSEKRSQQVVESSSMKGKDIAREPRSPPSTKARTLRRQSLTGIPPPPGSNRRSSLEGGTSTDARPTDNRNAKTPPPVRSSIKLTNRWM